MQFHGVNPDADNRLAVLLNLAFCWYQCHGASNVLPLIENLDAPAPSNLLAIVNLAQIQHVSLDYPAISYSPVLHQTPIAVLLAILFAPTAPQKHDGTRL